MNLLKSYKSYFILICILYFLFRLIGLGFDQTNNDSQRWFIRSEGFLQAIKDGNFSDTHQKYHPGVTMMIVNSFLRQSFYTYQYSFFSQKIDIMSPNFFPYTNFISKFGIIFVVFIVLLLQTWLIKNLWNEKISLFYLFFISIEPYLVGINRWFHLTSFEVVFSFTSILLLLYWLKVNKSVYFVLSAIFFGLGVLTKVTTLISGLVIFVILFSYFLNQKKIKVFFYYFLIYLLTLFILYPALWVDLQAVSLNIFLSIFNAVSEDARASQLNSQLNYFYYPLVLLFKLSPIILFMFIFSFTKFKNFFVKFEAKILYLLILIYLLFLGVSDQKIDRYSLVFFPPIILISSIFISELSITLRKFVLISSVLFSIWVGIYYSTQFSAYYSPLFGGTNSALRLGIYENGGSFFNEAAFYLNKTQPDKKVFVPDNYEAFSLFYFGKSQREKASDTDFVVTSLDIDRLEFNDHGCNEKVAEFGSFEKSVVTIFKCYKIE